jgi:hypothetical protein
VVRGYSVVCADAVELRLPAAVPDLSGVNARTATRRSQVAILVTTAALFLAAGCASLRQVMALRQVHFDIERAEGIRLAGVALEPVRSFSDLGVIDAGRLAGAVTRGAVPLQFDLIVRGVNPADNRTTARMLRMTWTLLLNGRETISGAIDTTYTFAPGEPTLVRVPVSLDLYQFFRSNARDAFELARGLSGAASRPTEIAVRAEPIIDSPLGAIRYPEPITIIRRTIGGELR